MTCPAGCCRLPGHFGFHTTVPAIAEREDAPKPTPESIVRDAFESARQKVYRDRGLISGFLDEQYYDSLRRFSRRLR